MAHAQNLMAHSNYFIIQREVHFTRRDACAKTERISFKPSSSTNSNSNNNYKPNENEYRICSNRGQCQIETYVI